MNHNDLESEDEFDATGKRRILKVRLRQDQVIRLHELRILKGTSIASLLEGILEDYFERHGGPSHLPNAPRGPSDHEPGPSLGLDD